MIFKENLTSKLIQISSHKIIKNFKTKKNILEIGCGDGNISEYLIKNSILKHHFYLSDISEKAVKKAKKKIKYKNITLRTGKFFDPWKKIETEFDVIISDVSSINDTVAKLSPWYKGITCDSGQDGLKNINIILNQIDNYMKENTYFIMPIISLCNVRRLDKILKKKFNVKYINKTHWPLPNFFEKNIKLMIKLKKRGYIDFNKKFNINTGSTSVAICKLKIKQS